MKKPILTAALIAFSLIGISQTKNDASPYKLSDADASLKTKAQISRRDSLDDEYKEPEFQGEEESDSEYVLDKKTIADPKKLNCMEK